MIIFVFIYFGHLLSPFVIAIRTDNDLEVVSKNCLKNEAPDEKCTGANGRSSFRNDFAWMSETVGLISTIRIWKNLPSTNKWLFFGPRRWGFRQDVSSVVFWAAFILTTFIVIFVHLWPNGLKRLIIFQVTRLR